jgi:hypothetical protein
MAFLRFFAYRQANYKKYGGDDDDEKSDSENMNWEVLTAKLVTAYKVINQQNTIIGRLGFAILLSDLKHNLKIILYKSKIDLLSSVVLRESNKIYVKGNFIQYLDSSNNFWSILFENENDRDEAIRLLEERCNIEWIEIESSIKTNDSNNTMENESENQEEKDAKNDGPTPETDATCADKSVETDPEEKQSKQLKANILSRMAKMGKRLVPSGSNKASDVSDSEGESPKRVARKPNTATSSPVLQIAKLHPSPHVPHTVEFRQTHNSNVISAASSDSSLNNLLMMQNTEIRFNLSKLDTKLDKLCDKIEVLSTSGSLGNPNDRNNNDSIREEDIVRLEEKLIAVKRENLSLKSIIRDLEEERSRTASMPHSTNELNELKVQIKALTQENKELKKHIIDLSEQNERIEILEVKLKNSLEANERAEVQLKTKEADLGEMKSQLNCSKRFAEDLQASLDELVKRKESIAYATKETQTVHSGEASKSTETHLQENHIKEMMNSLYFKLCERISNINELKHSEVLKVIGLVIKQETQETLRKNVTS